MFYQKNALLDKYIDEELEDPLSKLTDNQGDWRVSTCSALYDLKYTTVKLKQYASKIKQILSCSLNETRKVKFNVTIESDDTLKKNEQDPSALSIIVRTTAGNEAEITSYVAILMSWGTYQRVPLGTHLPYLLERGRQQIGDTVKMMLTKLFDCCITPVQFTQEHMILFAIKFCQLDAIEGKHIKLLYKLNKETKATITLTVDIAGILTIFESVENMLEDVTPEELVEKVYVGLQRHMYHHGKIDISVLELCKISHPHAAVSTAGNIGIKSCNILDFVLQFLNEAYFKNN